MSCSGPEMQDWWVSVAIWSIVQISLFYRGLGKCWCTVGKRTNGTNVLDKLLKPLGNNAGGMKGHKVQSLHQGLNPVNESKLESTRTPGSRGEFRKDVTWIWRHFSMWKDKGYKYKYEQKAHFSSLFLKKACWKGLQIINETKCEWEVFT